MSGLGYLAKLKRNLGLTIGAYFLHDFSMKMFRVLMADREKKRARQKYKNLNISRTKRAFKMK